MKDDIIPDQHHVARLCFKKTIQDGKLTATAFLPRPGENYLSVNWLEYLKCKGRTEEIVSIRETYNSKFDKLKNEARIAVLNVGVTREKVQSDSSDNRSLDFSHVPGIDDVSHSGIFNFENKDLEIAQLIRSTVEQNNIYKAK